MTQPFWPEWVERFFARHTGPDDPFDPAVNGDPSSTLGEDDESGFDEMADWPEPDFEAEDGEEEEAEDC